MFKKIISLFIRWSIIKKYIQSSYKPVDSCNIPYMDADVANYWVLYILTGKSDKQLNHEIENNG
jgi:hypothetical protein